MDNENLNSFISTLKFTLAEHAGTSMSRPDGTKALSQEIRKSAKACGYRCISEYPAGLIEGRNSYIDFVCLLRRGFSREAIIAIELDSSNKKWSIEKLLTMKERGFNCIWIRWKSPMTIKVPESINLIDLTNSAQ